MSVYIKQGVCGSYSRPIAWALGKIHKLCQKHDLDVLITSIGEGVHIPPSLHYLEPSDAIDWRPIFVVDRKAAECGDVEIPFVALIAITKGMIKECLSMGRFANQFDVVAGQARNYFHTEYDPKETP